MVLVYGFTFNGEADHCVGSRSGFVIAANYPNMDRLMSLLLTAKASQSIVTVHTDIPEGYCWAPKFTVSNYMNIK